MCYLQQIYRKSSLDVSDFIIMFTDLGLLESGTSKSSNSEDTTWCLLDHMHCSSDLIFTYSALNIKGRIYYDV